MMKDNSNTITNLINIGAIVISICAIAISFNRSKNRAERLKDIQHIVDSIQTQITADSTKTFTDRVDSTSTTKPHPITTCKFY